MFVSGGRTVVFNVGNQSHQSVGQVVPPIRLDDQSRVTTTDQLVPPTPTYSSHIANLRENNVSPSMNDYIRKPQPSKRYKALLEAEQSSTSNSQPSETAVTSSLPYCDRPTSNGERRNTTVTGSGIETVSKDNIDVSTVCSMSSSRVVDPSSQINDSFVNGASAVAAVVNVPYNMTAAVLQSMYRDTCIGSCRIPRAEDLDARITISVTHVIDTEYFWGQICSPPYVSCYSQYSSSSSYKYTSSNDCFY